MRLQGLGRGSAAGLSPKSCACVCVRCWGAGGVIQEASSNRVSHSGLCLSTKVGAGPLAASSVGHRICRPALSSGWKGQVLETRGPLGLGAFWRGGPWAPSGSSPTPPPSPKGLQRSWHCLRLLKGPVAGVTVNLPAWVLMCWERVPHPYPLPWSSVPG